MVRAYDICTQLIRAALSYTKPECSIQNEWVKELWFNVPKQIDHTEAGRWFKAVEAGKGWGGGCAGVAGKSYSTVLRSTYDSDLQDTGLSKVTKNFSLIFM